MYEGLKCKGKVKNRISPVQLIQNKVSPSEIKRKLKPK